MQKTLSIVAIMASFLFPAVGYALDTVNADNTTAMTPAPVTEALPMDLAAEMTEGDLDVNMHGVQIIPRHVQTTTPIVVSVHMVERCTVTPLLSDVGTVKRCEMVAE